MRSNFSHFALHLTAIVGLTAVALAQTDDPPEQIRVPEPTVIVVHSDLEGQTLSNASPGMLKKLEDWVGLTDIRLEELTSKAEKLLTEIAKMKKLRSEATGVSQTQAPATPLAASDVPSAPTPPTAPTAPPAAPAVVQAEIGNTESFDSLPGEPVGDTAPLPVLGRTTPDWVKKGLVLGNEHSLAISSTLMPELEECREDLKTRMMSEVRMYLNKHVLEYSDATKLPELTQEYVEKYWVKKGQEFDNVQDRPSGTYHQLWIGLHISSEQLAKIREWEKHNVRELRVKKVGIFSGLGVFAVALLSGAVGLLARREKAKLKK